MQPRRSGPPPLVWIGLAAGVALIVVVLIVVLVSGSSENQALPSPPSASSDALPPPPPDRGPTVAWIQENKGLIDGFAAAAPRSGATRAEECEPAATRLNTAVGSVGDYIRRVEEAPDPVLAELLANNAQAVRALLGACQAGNVAQVEEERRNLTAGLELVELRRRQLR